LTKTDQKLKTDTEFKKKTISTPLYYCFKCAHVQSIRRVPSHYVFNVRCFQLFAKRDKDIIKRVEHCRRQVPWG